MGARGATFGLLAAALAACTLIVPANSEQCTSDEDCRKFASNAVCRSNVCTELVTAPDAEADAPPPDPQWGCLGKVPQLLEDRSSPVDARFAFVDILLNPLAGVTAKLCGTIDIDCAQPIGAPLVADETGAFTVKVHTGFRGYLELLPGDAQPDLLPSMVYVPRLDAKHDANPTFTLALMTKTQFLGLTERVGGAAKDELGHVVYVATDCQDKYAAGVSARAETVTADTYYYYLDSNAAPSRTQQSTSEATGIGGIVNLSPGFVTMTYSREGGGRIGSQSISIRAGFATYVMAAPTP